jgi:diguanylate cyclase (GGDEF)-like protein
MRLRSAVRVAQWAGVLVLFAALPQASGIAFAALIGALILIALQIILSQLLRRVSLEQIASQETLAKQADEQRQQVELLFTMTDMLQSAESHEDAGQVLEATASQLLPNLRGALYIFNNSQDRLDLACKWPHDGNTNPTEALVPGNCWALKRGKIQFNDPHAPGLCCAHNNGVYSTVEVPMVARGTVHGLLMLGTDDPDARTQLRRITRTVQALADSMSLALANIALREKLRTQSLRDPLTGLYNRRYMEDALERYLDIAARNGTDTSVLMIDLDHFKRLNDTHGHAKGDTVLREVAGQIVGALRPADVAARYGGEELLVILPGCGLQDALLKAEMLRARIEGLSDLHGTQISASFGVASVPETSSGMADVVKLADAALYEAKKAGRNCVRSTTPRSSASIPRKPRLAAS